MTAGIKANVDGSAAIQVGGTDVITLTSGGAATFVTSPTTVQAGTAAAPSITFSGDTNTGIYSPGADTIAFTEGGVESMRIDSAGNVGIGTTSPVTDSITFVRGAGRNAILDLVGNGNTPNTTGLSILQGTDNNAYIYNRANAGIIFGSNNTERARFTGAGEFLVGTTTPGGYQMAVSGAAPSVTGIKLVNTSGSSSNLNMFAASSSYASFGVAANSGWLCVEGANNLTVGPTGAGNVTFVTNGSERMRLDASGNLGLGRTASTRRFEINAIPVAANQLNGLRLQWAGGDSAAAELLLGTDGSGIPFTSLRTGNDGNSFMTFFTGSGPTERVRITSGGGFTCAGIYNSTVGATNRDVFVDNGGVVGYVSSIRASKTNIQDLTDTSWLHQLNPVTFHYRKKDEEGNYTDETDGDIQYGMIAEDVEQVRPDLCFYDEVDGEQELRGIQYSKLVPVLLKAIQEQQAMIDELKAKVAALEGA